MTYAEAWMTLFGWRLDAIEDPRRWNRITAQMRVLTLASDFEAS